MLLKKSAGGDLQTRVLSSFPSPLATGYKKLKENRNLKIQDILDYFDLISGFAGNIALADYVQQGVPSEKINLKLTAYIRAMSMDRWLEVLKQLIQFLGKKAVIPELGEFRKNFYYSEHEIFEKIQKLKIRSTLTEIPFDKDEMEEATELVDFTLECLDFLCNYQFFCCTEKGVFLIKGTGEKKKTSEFSFLKPGEIIMTSLDKKKKFVVSPFITYLEPTDSIRFTNFNTDRETYQMFMKNPTAVKSVKEFQNISGGSPDFSSYESQAPEHPSFAGFKEELEEELTRQGSKRILVTGPPGCGKTMLITRLEKFVNPAKYTIIRYYLEEDHILASTGFFTRFFYKKLNSLLEPPLPIDMKGTGWQKFKKQVLTDFAKSGKNVILAIDSADCGIKPVPGEKVAICDYLKMSLPSNIVIIATARSGFCTNCFTKTIRLKPCSTGEIPSLAGVLDADKSKLDAVGNLYGGLRGFINKALTAAGPRHPEIPEIIKTGFSDLLNEYKFHLPAREKVIRMLAAEQKPVLVKTICEKTGLPVSAAASVLSRIQPILSIKWQNEDPCFELFIPAFAQYVRSLK
ncbi:MAG: ATP-binding protein [Firmicutes bacterium]|nr:ATP-binding protein [Bacillota bacterium]